MNLVEQRLATALSAAVLGAVLAPVRHNWTAKPRDGFPLSYYPMFSARRAANVYVHYLIGVTADGERIRLPHHFAGPGGLNQVRRQIRRLVRENRTDELCQRAAAELVRRRARRKTGPYHLVVAVHVVRGRFHLDSCFTNGEVVGTEKVLATVDCVAPA